MPFISPMVTYFFFQPICGMLNVSHLQKWKYSEGLNNLLKMTYLGRIGVFLLHLPGPGPLQLLSGKITQELREKRFQKHPRISYPYLQSGNIDRKPFQSSLFVLGRLASPGCAAGGPCKESCLICSEIYIGL